MSATGSGFICTSADAFAADVNVSSEAAAKLENRRIDTTNLPENADP
jgi:hypothetical protein